MNRTQIKDKTKRELIDLHCRLITIYFEFIDSSIQQQTIDKYYINERIENRIYKMKTKTRSTYRLIFVPKITSRFGV